MYFERCFIKTGLEYVLLVFVVVVAAVSVVSVIFWFRGTVLMCCDRFVSCAHVVWEFDFIWIYFFFHHPLFPANVMLL